MVKHAWALAGFVLGATVSGRASTTKNSQTSSAELKMPPGAQFDRNFYMSCIRWFQYTGSIMDWTWFQHDEEGFSERRKKASIWLSKNLDMLRTVGHLLKQCDEEGDHSTLIRETLEKLVQLQQEQAELLAMPTQDAFDLLTQKARQKLEHSLENNKDPA